MAATYLQAQQGAQHLTSNRQSQSRAPGLPRDLARPALLHDATPRLLVMVDTEEEFDWSRPFDRSNIGVRHLDDVPRLQAVFDAAAVIPTYIIDYPIAVSKRGTGYFCALAVSGAAQIGMQLHPWVTPPHDEVVNTHNSYCCNLPASLEVRKLQTLFDTIVKNIGLAPVIFKSGRYGIAHDTLDHIRTLGLLIDTSIIPGYDLSADGGPDFSHHTSAASWFDSASGPVLELPTTGGYVGALSRLGPWLMAGAHSSLGKTIKLEPILSRLNLLSRIRLSPEGYTLSELKQLTRALHRRGDSVFSLSLHSPSSGIGYTPYVRNEADRAQLFATIRDYVTWFRDELGGVTTTPTAILHEVSA
jgi:hypothetical protein